MMKPTRTEAIEHIEDLVDDLIVEREAEIERLKGEVDKFWRQNAELMAWKRKAWAALEEISKWEYPMTAEGAAEIAREALK